MYTFRWNRPYSHMLDTEVFSCLVVSPLASLTWDFGWSREESVGILLVGWPTNCAWHSSWENGFSVMCGVFSILYLV